jgi:anti-sigma factor RsiW
MTPHSGHAVPGADEAHREAQDLLPWLANGSLAGTELERVQAHLKVCPACRAELASLHTLRAAGPGSMPDVDADRALARLLPQLDATAAVPAAAPVVPRPVAMRWRDRLAANDPGWLRAAVALQCCVIAVLVALLARPSADAGVQAGAYRALGAGQATHGGLVVAFKPDTPEQELRRIVLASGARVVGGPTVTGAWLLEGGEAPAAIAARLRAQPAVILAEPLGDKDRP